MASRQRPHHLNAEQKRFICRMFAEFREPTEVQRALEEEHGVSLALSTIYHYHRHPKWQPVIAEMRQALLSRLDDLPICSKFWRLKQLQDLYVTENKYRVTRYSGRSEIPIQEKPVGELRQLLALAAQELGELRQVQELRGSLTLEELVLRAGRPDGDSGGK